MKKVTISLGVALIAGAVCSPQAILLTLIVLGVFTPALEWKKTDILEWLAK